MTAPVPAPGSHIDRLRAKIEQRRDPDARLTLIVDDAYALRFRKAGYDDDLKAQRGAAAAGGDGEKRLTVLSHYIARHVEAVLAVDGERVVPLYDDGAEAALDARLAELLGAPDVCWTSKPDLLRYVVGDGAIDDIASALSEWSVPGGSVKAIEGESPATRR